MTARHFVFAGLIALFSSPLFAAAMCPSTVEATWRQGDPPLTLRGRDSFCFLTGARGSFRGGGEMVRVRYNEDDKWVIEGSSRQEGVGGNAVCFDKACFWSQSGGTLASFSQQFEATSYGEEATLPTDLCWNGIVDEEPTWNGRAFTAISGIHGRFEGAGEFVSIDQSSIAAEPSRVQARDSSCTNDFTRGYAYSFLVGDSWADTVARFAGPGGYGRASVAGEYTVSAIGSSASTTMIPTWMGVCYFSEITGRFRGGGEEVRITAQVIDGVKRWVLKARHAGTSGGVWARARCATFSQS